MAGSINPEGACGAIKAILTSDLPAKLDLLDTEYNDAVVLEDVAAYWLAPQARYDLYPAVVIVIRSSDIPEDLRNQMIQWHQIEVQVLLAGNDVNATLTTPGEMLAARLQRTVRGIQEVLKAKQQLTITAVDYCDHQILTGIDYSDFFDVEQGMRRDARLMYAVMVST